MQRSKAWSSKIIVYIKILSYRKKERKEKERVGLDFYSTRASPVQPSASSHYKLVI